MFSGECSYSSPGGRGIDGLDLCADRQQFFQINTGCNPHLMESIDQVFGCSVAFGSWCKWAATEPGCCGFNGSDSGVISVKCIHDPESEGVVAMKVEMKSPGIQ